MEVFRNQLIARFGVAILIGTVLWSLWEFGLEDSLLASMGPTARHVTEVLVAAAVLLLALIWPVSEVLQEFAEFHQEAETSLGKTERRYRKIVEATHDIILEINEAGSIVFVNPAIKLLGYDRDQLLHRPVADILEPSIRDQALPRITTRRIGPRATLNFPVTLLTDEDSVLSEEVPRMDFFVDATGLWQEPDEIVSTKGSEKTFIGTLFIARVRINN